MRKKDRQARLRAERLCPEEGLMALLLDGDRRAALVEEASADDTLILANRLERLLRTCDATSAEIERLVRSLPPDGRGDLDFQGVIWHPKIADAPLLELAREGRFIDTLGHRAGPHALLHFLADRYAYDEAITTLALAVGMEDSSVHRDLAWSRASSDRGTGASAQMGTGRDQPASGALRRHSTARSISMSSNGSARTSPPPPKAPTRRHVPSSSRNTSRVSASGSTTQAWLIPARA